MTCNTDFFLLLFLLLNSLKVFDNWYLGLEIYYKRKECIE